MRVPRAEAECNCYPRRQKKQIFFGYFPPISVNSVYFFVGFSDKHRHSAPISEFIPQIMGGLRPPMMTADNSERVEVCLCLSTPSPPKKRHYSQKEVRSSQRNTCFF